MKVLQCIWKLLSNILKYENTFQWYIYDIAMYFKNLNVYMLNVFQ
jgi:hypothetical protein